MANKLTITQVLSDLKKIGHNFKENPNKKGTYLDSSGHNYTSPELYRWHKSHFTKGRTYKSIVKKLSNGKDRTTTRNALANEKFDDLPINQRVKEEDVWGWD